MHCNVCKAELTRPLYESRDNSSITTMNTLVEGRTRVFFCDSCAHLQTNELPDLVTYYAQEYDINSASEDDDQLYKVVDGTPVFRADHQATTLMDKLHFADDWRVLDYGCAKAPTLKKVLQARPGLKPFLFDVTDRYVPFWRKFPLGTSWSTHQPDPRWTASMDLVLSFYALEHVADLQQALDNVKRLLKPGGIFYFIVPNAYENTADFIVADHINHFSRLSLAHMLGVNGFSDVEIDDRAHESAFVVHAVFDPNRAQSGDAELAEIEALRARAQAMGDYWADIAARIRAFEEKTGDAPLAIYGAGFYGNFLASSLAQPARARCFVDQNLHLQGRTLNGRPVIAPLALPADIRHVLVGLNPRSARTAIASIPAWRDLGIDYFFL